MRLKSIAGWVAAVMGLLCIPLIGAAIIRRMSESEWKSVEADARVAGVPLTPAEALKNYVPGPDSENAAEGVKQVLRSVLKPPTEGSNEFQAGMRQEFDAADKRLEKGLKSRSHVKYDPNLPELRAGIKVFQKQIQDLEVALDLPDWNFKRPWNQGMALLLPDLAQFKRLSRVLRARAIVAAASGDKEETLRAIRALRRFGDHLRTEPCLYSYLVGISMEKQACNTAFSATRISPTDQQLTANLLALLEPEMPSVDWKLLWQSEQAIQVSSLDFFVSEKGLREFGVRNGEGRTVSMRQLLTTRSKIVRLLLEADKEWKSKTNSAAVAKQIGTKYSPPIEALYLNYHQVFQALSGDSKIPQFVLEAGAFERLDSYRRLTWLAIKMIANTPSEWKLPAEASQPKWLDPFAGKPMRLKKTKAGFIIYSLGENKVDDGGRTGDYESGYLDDVISYPVGP